MLPFSSFFLILLVAVVFSQLFSRMRIPWVVALLVGGMAIGPGGLALFETDPTIQFLASIGLVFLMFMAGLESKFSNTAGIKKHLAITALTVALIPTIVGYLIAALFGYSVTTSILVGIIFMSSSVALLIPQLHQHRLIDSELGKMIVGAAIVVDAVSLFLLSVLLQSVAGTFTLATIMVYVALIAGILLVAWLVPKIRWLTFSEEYAEEQDLFEKELRFIILILIGFVVLFELVGLHAIVAAFFAGLVLASSIKSRIIKAKLHAISYGFFVPVFFVVVGASVDLSVFKEGLDAFTLTGAIVVGLIVSKFLSGWLAGRANGYTSLESSFLGIAVVPQLSTALAVAFLGFGAGLLDESLLAAVVVLVVATSTVTPLIVEWISPKLTSQHVAVRHPEEGEGAESESKAS